MSVVATSQLQRSLHLFITFDQLACLGAGGVMLGLYLWLYPSGHLLLLAVVAAVTTAVVGSGRRPLVAGNLEGAVLCVAVANLGAALAAAAVATFSVPITVVAAMLPSALAVPYVGARTLSRINVTSMCVSLVAVLLGTTQDFSGADGRATAVDPFRGAGYLHAFHERARCDGQHAQQCSPHEAFWRLWTLTWQLRRF